MRRFPDSCSFIPFYRSVSSSLAATRPRSAKATRGSRLPLPGPLAYETETLVSLGTPSTSSATPEKSLWPAERGFLRPATELLLGVPRNSAFPLSPSFLRMVARRLVHGAKEDRVLVADRALLRARGAPQKGSSSTPQGLPSGIEGLPSRIEGLPPGIEGLPSRIEGLPPGIEGLPSRIEGLPPIIKGRSANSALCQKSQ